MGANGNTCSYIMAKHLDKWVYFTYGS